MTNDSVTNYMEQTINRNLLRYAVQRAIFCPRCGRVMDIRRAVLVTASKEGQEKTVCLCAACYDAQRPHAEGVAAGKSITLDVIDGRILNGKGKGKK